MNMAVDGSGTPRVTGELVTFYSRDRTRLDGILYCPSAPRAIVIHVPGSLGNFYHNHFLRWLAGAYRDAGIGMLSFNLQAHDGIAEGYDKDGNFRYVGGSVVPFETSIPDIQGALDFCQSIAPVAVLQGHSLGCDRITWAAMQTGFAGRLILLSPCDSLELQERWLSPRAEKVSDQIVRLEKNALRSPAIAQISTTEYGVHQKGEDYINPVSIPTLLSIMKGPAFSLFCKNVAPPASISNDSIAVIGGSDPLQTWDYDEMMPLVRRTLPNVRMLYYKTSDHEFAGCESDVALKLAGWVADGLSAA